MEDLSFNINIKPELVLSNYRIFESSDMDEVRSSAARVLCANDLKLDSSNKILNASLYYRKVGGVGFGRLSYGTEVAISPVVFEDFILIQIPIRGSEKIYLGNDKILCTPKMVGIINSEVKTIINHSPNTEKIMIRVDRGLIEKNLQQIIGRTLDTAVEFNSTMSLETNEGSQWLQMIGWISDLISKQSDISHLMITQIENNIVNMLLNFQHSNFSDEIHNNSVSVTPSFIRQIENYIHDNAHKPIAINDMAEYAGVSSRSLFIGFRKYKNTTPMRYLKEVRLQYVNEGLKRGHVGSDTVTNIALKWGFNHLGHFSTDYKRRFGETPYETLLR